jgi:hypothetical protein
MEGLKNAMMHKNCKWNADKNIPCKTQKKHKKNLKVMEVLENAIMCDSYKST